MGNIIWHPGVTRYISFFSQRAMDIYAKNFFLTFPKCDLHPEYALTAFRQLPHSSDLSWAKVVQEHHEDGSLHLHAILGFAKRIRIRDETYFDLYFGDKLYHGNYQAVKSLKDALAYVEKEGGACAEFGTVPSGGKKDSAYATALNTATSAQEFHSVLLELAPRDAVLYRGAILEFAERHYGGSGSGFDPVRPLQDFTVPVEMGNWITSNLNVCF